MTAWEIDNLVGHPGVRWVKQRDVGSVLLLADSGERCFCCMYHSNGSHIRFPFFEGGIDYCCLLAYRELFPLTQNARASWPSTEVFAVCSSATFWSRHRGLQDTWGDTGRRKAPRGDARRHEKTGGDTRRHQSQPSSPLVLGPLPGVSGPLRNSTLSGVSQRLVTYLDNTCQWAKGLFNAKLGEAECI